LIVARVRGVVVPRLNIGLNAEVAKPQTFNGMVKKGFWIFDGM